MIRLIYCIPFSCIPFSSLQGKGRLWCCLCIARIANSPVAQRFQMQRGKDKRYLCGDNVPVFNNLFDHFEHLPGVFYLLISENAFSFNMTLSGRCSVQEAWWHSFSNLVPPGFQFNDTTVWSDWNQLGSPLLPIHSISHHRDTRLLKGFSHIPWNQGGTVQSL